MADTHGFAAACLQLYKDKLVEINTGETRTTLMLADFQIQQKSIIRGRITGAIGDALIVECSVRNEKKTIILNCWGITSICEVGGTVSMKDLYVDEEFSANRRNG